MLVQSQRFNSRSMARFHYRSFMCTTYTCVYIHWEAGWDLGLSVFFFIIFSFQKKKAKDMNVTTSTRIYMDLSYIDHQSWVLNYCWKLIKNHHHYGQKQGIKSGWFADFMQRSTQSIKRCESRHFEITPLLLTPPFYFACPKKVIDCKFLLTFLYHPFPSRWLIKWFFLDRFSKVRLWWWWLLLLSLLEKSCSNCVWNSLVFSYLASMSGVVWVVCPFADDEELKNIHVDLALLVWGPALLNTHAPLPP